MSDIKVKVVCADCNAGWMSALELSAKPLLEQMIDGRNIDLDVSESRTVALWAVKTAMMFEFNDRPTIAFTHQQRQAFYLTRHIQPEASVHLAVFQDSNALRIVHTGGSVSNAMTFDALGTMGVTVIVLGRCCLLVASGSDKYVRGVLDTRLTVDDLSWRALFRGEARAAKFRPNSGLVAPMTHDDVTRLITIV